VATLAAVLGALVGSFLGAALVRMPQGRSAMTGRSSCDACGRRLGFAELVPIVSYLVLRGGCRQCGARIDPWQFAAEAGGAAIGLVSALLARDGLQMVGGLLLGWQLLLLGLLDLRHFWLPRGLVLGLAASGAAVAFARFGPALPLATEALAGGALGFAMLWIIAALYRRVRGREGMGGGDPALLGAIGLWVGPVGTVVTVLAASLFALAGAVAMLGLGRKVGAQTALPLGSALGLAGWFVWLLQAR
jgi:leader peptidase (prepilin peptidase)/N-methyltransferase